ncbi:DJ-1 family glyoxalase III [Mycoplasma yeatsii]|uniref:4-methyl-5(B-hydroxyethyl)-thiazole monophosphate biosynthesis n=1 Tax=Mycoplasma yeatsii TaxID=51365 RepID=A0ABU0NFA3_9MOLU|nr:DJ-1 family glyoxalase III [Mycoplasma yeatsii]MDQ0567807.1 4-methyl-5(b-hydroxyethyl)-thiazole monophosphate biosynthesis [Mycoplasma yeatsii]
MKKIIMYLNPGFEETEAVSVCDILKRADIQVDIVSTIDDLEVTGAHNITIKADKLWKDININDYDGMFLPGGSGVMSLVGNQRMIDEILYFNSQNKLIASICAAPQIIGQTKLLDNKNVSYFPGCNQFLENSNYVKKAFATENNIITGASMGSAILFGLELVRYLKGEQVSKELEKNLVILGK